MHISSRHPERKHENGRGGRGERGGGGGGEGNHGSREEWERKEQLRRRRIDFCKRSSKIILSNVALCILITLYAVAGAFVFQLLEDPNEKEECIQSMNLYVPMEESTVQSLWEISLSYPSDGDMDQAVEAFQAQMETFMTNVLALDYDGSNCTLMGETGGPTYKWSFPGALLFSVTVFTTIGYGNIAPKTFWGRLVCIAYSLLGIPLMLLCLANIGEVMADIFRFVYGTVCCCGCFRGRRNRNNNKNSITTPGSLDAAESDISTNTGHVRHSTWKYGYGRMHDAVGGKHPEPVIRDDDDDDDDEDADERISVPLTITMGLVGGYLFMGSVLFGVWENWDWLTSAYYCFITISTIGFGDVVPGSAGFQTVEDELIMVGVAVYIMFGMAIMSMAFNLIQEEFVVKFQWLGEKLGVGHKKQDKEEEEGEEEEGEEAAREHGRKRGGSGHQESPVPPYTKDGGRSGNVEDRAGGGGVGGATVESYPEGGGGFEMSAIRRKLSSQNVNEASMDNVASRGGGGHINF